MKMPRREKLIGDSRRAVAINPGWSATNHQGTHSRHSWVHRGGAKARSAHRCSARAARTASTRGSPVSSGRSRQERINSWTSAVLLSSRNSPTSRQAGLDPSSARRSANGGPSSRRDAHLLRRGRHARRSRSSVDTVGEMAPLSYRQSVADEVPARLASSRWLSPAARRAVRRTNETRDMLSHMIAASSRSDSDRRTRRYSRGRMTSGSRQSMASRVGGLACHPVSRARRLALCAGWFDSRRPAPSSPCLSA
jgi:hypothetical protein